MIVSAALRPRGREQWVLNQPRIGVVVAASIGSAQQGGFLHTDEVEACGVLEFAVLCWELLGSFLVPALFGAAGFYTPVDQLRN